MKTDKLFNATYSFFIGIGLMFLGILMLIGRKWLYINVINIFIVAIFFLSIKQLINAFIGKEKAKKMNFIRSFINIIFCVVFSIFKNIPLSIVPLMFASYLLLNGIIKIINGIIFFTSKAHGFLSEFFLGFVYLIVSIIVILAPIKNLDAVLVLLGIYILLLGINYMADFISFLIPRHVKDKVKRHIRISLPAIVESIIPYTVLNEINYLVNKEDYDDSIILENKKEEEADIEVFVHISPNGWNRLGHVDVYYNNMVLSYGGYDDASLKFFRLVGDGVVFTSFDKDEYISFCINHSSKTLFAFGLKLTEKQKKSIDSTFNSLFDNLVEWKCPYEVDLLNNDTKKVVRKKKKGTKLVDKEYKDYASNLYKATNVKFYKIKSGRFKKYFAIGNNCSKLADYVVGQSGIDLLKMYGVITPGTYYEYLNREYKKKGSMVISREIYNAKNVKKVNKYDGFSR